MSAWAIEARRGPRGLRPFVLAGAVAFLGVVLAVSGWRFVSPPDSASALSAVRLAPASDFAPGSVTPYRITSEGDVRPTPDPREYLAAVVPTGNRLRGDGIFYIVRLPDGDFRVFSAASTHIGELVVWDTSGEPFSGTDYVGVFIEPGHAEQWTIDGIRIFGPAPRDLDRYDWHVDDSGVLVIDLSNVVRGGDSNELPPVYNVNEPGWPTSGWPNVAAS